MLINNKYKQHYCQEHYGTSTERKVYRSRLRQTEDFLKETRHGGRKKENKIPQIGSDIQISTYNIPTEFFDEDHSGIFQYFRNYYRPSGCFLMKITSTEKISKAKKWRIFGKIIGYIPKGYNDFRGEEMEGLDIYYYKRA